jgi:uncharacterized protein YlzI (FlbEa/FlbD family)
MKLLKLTRLNGNPIIFNWSNVISISNTTDSFGNEYCEVMFVGGRNTSVKEDLSEVESQLN